MTLLKPLTVTLVPPSPPPAMTVTLVAPLTVTLWEVGRAGAAGGEGLALLTDCLTVSLAREDEKRVEVGGLQLKELKEGAVVGAWCGGGLNGGCRAGR